MKMYMPLVAQEDGIVELEKQAGTMLEAGDLLGTLILDDPFRVHQVSQPFLGHLPDFGPPQVVGVKSAQRFLFLYGILNDILDGFDNQFAITLTFQELLSVLRDPELPYSEWSVHLSALSSSMPQSLTACLTQIINRAKVRGREFPAKKLSRALEEFLNGGIESAMGLLRPVLAPLIDVMKKYDEGQRVHEFNVSSQLLEHYIAVESPFSDETVSDEEKILRLRGVNQNDIIKVIQTILSHNNISAKNDLILAILDEYSLTSREYIRSLTKHFIPAVRKLTEIGSLSSANVSLKAREFLIQCAMPSVEERTRQIGHMLKSSLGQSQYSEPMVADQEPVLKIPRELMDFKHTILDVLPIFFYDKDPWVSLAAQESYVRRACSAHSLKQVQYHKESSDQSYILSWKFSLRRMGDSELKRVGLRQSYNPHLPATLPYENGESLKQVSSISDLSHVIKTPDTEPTGRGVIVPAYNLDEAEERLRRALRILPVNSGPNNDLSAICMVAISDTEDLDDKETLQFTKALVEQSKGELLASRVSRLTFICGHKEGIYPWYYNFIGPEYGEDQNIRHSEPALASLLELDRLSNFTIKPIPTKNHSVHTYEAVSKELHSDKRYFARGIVEEGPAQDKVLAIDYLISESGRLISEILDVLEVIENNNSDLNHIFVKFLPVLSLQPEDVEMALGSLFEKFGHRMLRLHVNGIEICVTHIQASTDMAHPFRIIATNPTGFVFRLETYVERKSKDGQWIFQGVGGTFKMGSLHQQPVSAPYPTEGLQSIQPKRHMAHIMGTQYVYDFPELFGRAIENSWLEAMRKCPSISEKQPSMGGFIACAELFLDEHDNLVECDRSAGTNTNGLVAWITTARTPEYPQGRKFIVIAHDITFRAGSFGLVECIFFNKCTQYAYDRGIPRIYISANSGGRVAIAEELIPHFRIAWKNPTNPEAGFKYLYLTPEAKNKFDNEKSKAAITEEVLEDGEVRHKIVLIADAKDGHGMDAMSIGSFMAALTNKAYEDIFTISLVTCRSVGRYLSLTSPVSSPKRRNLSSLSYLHVLRHRILFGPSRSTSHPGRGPSNDPHWRSSN